MNPLHVLQLSDIHFAATPGELYGRDPELTLALVLDDVARRRLSPDLVVVTGDLVHDGSPDGYRRLGRALAGLGMPVFCVAGNHDFFQPLEANLPGPAVHMERVVHVGDWLLVFIDSNAHGRVATPSGYLEDRPNRFIAAARGGMTEPDREWLERVLAATTAAHVMAWMHHPPLAPPGIEALASPEFTDSVFDVLAGDGRVRAVAAGHVHTAYECRRDGIRVFACPSTWLAMDFEHMTMAPPGYRFYALHPSGDIEASACHVDDERFADRSPLPPWAISMISGDFDHDALEHLSQEEIIAAFSPGGGS